MRIVRCDRTRHSDAILAILNDAIINSTALYDYEPRTPENMVRWFEAKEQKDFPVIGVEDESGQLMGFASYGTFRAWPAYKYSVEHSVYVDARFRGQGLGRVLLELMPAEPEVRGLLALMLLIDARRAARTDAHGAFVRLSGQDRGAWRRPLIEEGQALLRECLAQNRPGPYQLQAAINAVHSDAPDAAHTDWRQALALYDQWMAIAPGAVVALNRAVVVAEIDGPELALRLVDELALDRYHLFHAVRADLLRRLGRATDAATAYRRAIDLCGNARERQFLEEQLKDITAS